MKKLLIGIIASMVVITGVAITASRSLAVLGEDGFAIPASAGIVRALENGAESELPMTEVAYQDVVYVSASGYYVGEDRKPIDLAFPIYTNNGATVRFLNEENWLVSAEVDLLPTYEGLYLNDGYTYNSDMTQADAEEFVFLVLRNGLFMNAQRAVFTNPLQDTEIPENSILKMDETGIRWYAPEDGTLVYGEETAVFDAKLTVGSHEYDYHNLLDALGLLHKAISLREQGQKTDDLEEEILQVLNDETLKRDDVPVPLGSIAGSSGGSANTQNDAADGQQSAEELDSEQGEEPDAGEPGEPDDGEIGETVDGEPGYSGDGETGEPEEGADSSTDEEGTESGESTEDAQADRDEDERTYSPTERGLSERGRAAGSNGGARRSGGSGAGSSGSSRDTQGRVDGSTGSQGSGQDGDDGDDDDGDSAGNDPDESKDDENEEEEKNESEKKDDESGSKTDGQGVIHRDGDNSGGNNNPGKTGNKGNKDGDGNNSGDSKETSTDVVDGTGTGGEAEYRDPVVGIENIQPWSYAIASRLRLIDDVNAIQRGVKITVYSRITGSGGSTGEMEGYKTYPSARYKGGTTVLRKTFMSGQELALSTVPPGTTLYLQYSYRYTRESYIKDEDGNEVRETARVNELSDFVEVRTPTVAEGGVKPVKTSWETVYAASSSAMQLNALKLRNTSAFDAEKTEFDFNNMKLNTLPYVSSLEYSMTPVGGGEPVKITVGPSYMTRAQQEGGVTFTSQQVLSSAKQYVFTVKAFDRYGNELPLETEGANAVYTSKRTPSVEIAETVNETDRYGVSLTIYDPDEALSKENGAKLPLKFYALDRYQQRSMLSGTINGASFDTGDSRILTLDAPVDGKVYDLVIDSFDYGVTYTLMADGSYDLQPNIIDTPAVLPRVEDANLGRMLAFTAPLSSGLVSFTSGVGDILDTSATINLTMNNKTTVNILPLIDAFYVVVTDRNGVEVSRTEVLESDFNRSFGSTSFRSETETVLLRAGTDDEAEVYLAGKQESYLGTNPWQSMLISRSEETGTEVWSTPMRLAVKLPKVLQSSSRYTVSVESVVIKAERYQIPTTLSVTSFTTKKVQPDPRMEDLFIAGGSLQFINMYIYDPDVTVLQNGRVYADLYYGDIRLQRQELTATPYEPGNAAFPGYLKTPGYQNVVFSDIEPDRRYTLKLIAPEFNDAEGYTSMEFNHVIAEWTDFSAEEEYLSGKLRLTALDYTSKLNAGNVLKRFVFEGDESTHLFRDSTEQNAEQETWTLGSNNYTTPVYALPEGTTFLQLSGYYPGTDKATVYFYKNEAGTAAASTASRQCSVSNGLTPVFLVPNDAVSFKLSLPGAAYLRANGLTVLGYNTPQRDLITGTTNASDNTPLGGDTAILTSKRYDTTSGAQTVNGTYDQLHMLPVKPGQLYVRSAGNEDYVYFWNGSGAYYGYQTVYNNAAFVVPDRVAFLSVEYRRNKAGNTSFYLVADSAAENGFSARADVTVYDRYGYLKTEVPVSVKLEISDSAQNPSYRDYAAFTPRSFTLTDQSGVGAKLYTLADEVLAAGLPAEKGWRMSLVTTYRGAEVVLHSITFRTDAAYSLIRCNEDMRQLAQNPYGNYLVVEPFVHTLSLDTTFYGVLDFNGQRITRGTNLTGDNKNLLNYNYGVIRNLAYTYPADAPESGHIIHTNYGTIDNLFIETEGERVIQATNRNLAMSNNHGTIRNFIVRLGGHLHLTSASASGIVALFGSNYGIIEDGYIYGVNGAGLVMYPQDGNVSTSFQYAMIAYQYYPQDMIRNVFAVYDTFLMYNAVNHMSLTGSLISRSSSGRFENIYQVGDFYDYKGPGTAPARTEAGRLAQNRMVGTLGQAGNNRNTYLVTPNDYTPYLTTLKTEIVRYQVLRDPAWQHNALPSDAFEIDKWVSEGFYPRLRLHNSMSRYQEFLPLPTESIRQAPVLVEDGWATDYGYDPAQYGHNNSGGFIVLRFRNDSNVTINDVVFKDVSTKIKTPCLTLNSSGDSHIYRAEYADDGLYNVLLNVRVPEGDACQYLSSYTVESFTYTAGANRDTVTANYATKNIDFWCEINSESGETNSWASINDHMNWNYVLTQDIYFTSLTEPAIRINGSRSNLFATSDFTGKLDGAGKTLHGITLNKIAEPSVFHRLGASAVVKNLIVEDLKLVGTGVTQYCGFIRAGSSGALAENVHIRKAAVESGGYVGALFAQVDGGVWCVGCSVAESTVADIPSNLSLRMGGVAGVLASAGYIDRCFARNVSLNVQYAASVDGVGGILGYTTYGGIHDCYATGSIRATANNVGGIVGALIPAENNFNDGRFWTDMALDIDGSSVGGIMGNTSKGVINSMSVGDILATASKNVHRIIGGGVVSKGTYFRQNYAFSGQSVSGVAPGAADYAIGLLSAQEMKNPFTWVDTIGLMDAWECSTAPDGYYPILLGRDGEPLYDQMEHLIPMPSGAEYTLSAQGAVEDGQNGSRIFRAKATLTHEGLDNTDNVNDVKAELDGMQTEAPGALTITGYNGYTVVDLVTDSNMLEKAKDLYRLDVKLNGKTYSAQVSYGTPIYWEIPDKETWDARVKDHGDQSENFRITGPIDFGNETTIHYNLKINRLEGPEGTELETIKAALEAYDSDSTKPRPVGFYNLNYTCDIHGDSWIALVSNRITGLCFDKIKLNYLVATENRSMTGAIANAYGIRDCVIRNVDMAVAANTATRCGFLGTNNENSRNIWLENISLHAADANTSTSKNYAGALCGYTDGSFPNVSGKNVTVTLKGQSYVGGLAGYVYWAYNDIDPNYSFGEYKNFNVSAGSIVGGLFGQHLRQIGSNSGSIVKISGTDKEHPFTVSSASGYAGGVVGYNYHVMQNIEVKWGHIYGYTNAGGFCGSEHGNNNSNIHVIECTVETTRPESNTGTSYAGGLYGHDDSASVTRDCSVRSCIVKGNNAVGGLVGGRVGTGGLTNCYVIDSTVTNTSNSDVGGTMCAGGLIGYTNGGTMYGCDTSTVRNTAVSGRTRAGGLIGMVGDTGRLIRRCFVAEDVTVTARASKAGGLIGSAQQFIIEDCASGAPVEVVQGENAGGLIGYVNADGAIRRMSRCYYVGTVTGHGRYVAGAIGHVDDTTYLTADNLQNVFLAVTVTGTDETKTALWLNDNIGDGATGGDGSVFIWKQSVVNGRSAEAMLAAADKANRGLMTSVVPTHGSLIDAEAFATADTYTSKGFTNKSLWSFKHFGEGNRFMPYPVNGSDTPVIHSNLASDGTTEKGIELPVPSGYNAGEARVYVSGIDCVNIEAAANTSVTVQIGSGGVQNVTTNENGVATVSYNFRDSLTVNDTTYAAEQLRRTVMTWGTGDSAYWYYIVLKSSANLGQLRYGDVLHPIGYLSADDPGSFIHLWQGKALDNNGNVYVLNGANTTAGTGDYQGQTRTLWSYMDLVDNKQVDVYLNFSVYAGARVDQTRLFMMFYTPRGTQTMRKLLRPVSPYQGLVYDGIIYADVTDASSSTQYFAVLDGNAHRLVNYGPTIYSTSWHNNRIDHISNTFNYDKPILVIRYDEKSVAVVNYSSNTVLEGLGINDNFETAGMFGSIRPNGLLGFASSRLSSLIQSFTSDDTDTVPTDESYLEAMEELNGSLATDGKRSGSATTGGLKALNAKENGDEASEKGEKTLTGEDDPLDENASPETVNGGGDPDGDSDGEGTGMGSETAAENDAATSADANANPQDTAGTSDGSGEGNADSASGSKDGGSAESGTGNGNGGSAESGTGNGNGGSAESGTGNGNGASAENGTGNGNGGSAESGTGSGNGASAVSGTGSGNGASAVSGTGSGNGANVEDSVAAAGGSAANGQQLAGQTAVSRETSVQSERVEMLFAEMTDAVYVKNEGLYDRNGELLVSEENLTYDPQKGLYVGDTLAYTKDTSAESDDTMIAMVSLARQQEAVLNGLGDMLVLYDPYTGAYSTRATAELLENGGRSNTEAENGIAEMAEEMEDSGFSIGSAFGRSLTDREESGFAWIAAFAAAGVLILVVLYFRVRKRRE